MTGSQKTALGCCVAAVIGIGIGLAIDKLRGNVSVSSRPPIEAPSTTTLPLPHSAREFPDISKLSGCNLVSALGSLDAKQLRGFIQSITDHDLTDPKNQDALSAALNVLATKDPEVFLRWVVDAGLPASMTLPAIETAAANLAKGNPDEGFQALRELKSPHTRFIAMRAYGSALAEREPEIALRQLLAAGLTIDAGSIVGNIWGARDPKAAVEFIGGLRGESFYTMQIGLRSVMSQWARQDPDGARSWIDSESDPLLALPGV